MINLSGNQTAFLEKEFNLSIQRIESMSKEEWKSVRMACYDIVLDEMLDDNDEYNEAGDGSERCSLASSIMDIKYKELKTPS